MGRRRGGNRRNDTLRHAGRGKMRVDTSASSADSVESEGSFFSLRRFKKPTPVEEDRNKLQDSPRLQHHGNISLRVTSGASDLRERLL